MQKTTLLILTIATLVFPQIGACATFEDNFNREGMLQGSQSSDGKYTWSVFHRKNQENLFTSHDRLNFNATGSVMYVRNKAMKQHDFDLAFDFTYLSLYFARSLSVNYRIQGKSSNTRLSDGGHAGGYVLYIERPSRKILRLRLLKESAGQTKPDTVIAKVDVPTANRWDITTRIHLQAKDSHHRVFIDNSSKPVIDVSDDEYLSAGWWNIADGGITQRAIDNLTFSSGKIASNSATNATVQQTLDNQRLINLKPLYPIHYTGRVSPTPQHVLNEWQFLTIDTNNFQVEVAHDAHNAISLAHDLLLHRVVEQSESRENVDHSPSDGSLTIYLGELESEFIKEIAYKLDIDLEDVVLPPRGYLIRRKGNNILAAGVDHRGAFYAAMTLYQSIGSPNEEVILRTADLNDWPEWSWYQSSYAIPGKRGLLWMAMQKIAGISLQQRHEWRNINPKGKPQFPGKWKNWQQAMQNHQEFNDLYDLLDRQLMFNIYAAKNRKSPMLDIANEKHIAQMIDVCAFAARMGIEHIMIAADDWTPAKDGQYVSPYPSEKQRFNDSAGRSHGILVRRLYHALKSQFPDLELSFVPAPYSIYQHGIPVKPSHQRYLRDLAEEIPDDVYLVWTGPKIRSLRVSRDDFLRWEGYVDNQRSYLWDNSAGPEPIKRWGTEFYEGFTADSQGKIFVNGDIFGRPHNLAFTINVSDYLWNPEAYNADLSFRDAAEKLYGIGNARVAEQFIRVYAGLRLQKKNSAKRLAILDELDSLATTMKSQGWAMRKPMGKLKTLRSQALNK